MCAIGKRTFTILSPTNLSLFACGIPGTHWVEVASPEKYQLSQTSVGVNVVWAVSREGELCGILLTTIAR